MAQLTIARAFGAPDAPTALFVGGIMVRGVRAIVDQGGDILVVLDRAAVKIEAGATRVEELGRTRRIVYPTDGAA